MIGLELPASPSLTRLKGRRAPFVRAILAGATPVSAVIEAGYTAKWAKSTASRLLNSDPAVIAAIAAAKAVRTEALAQAEEVRRLAVQSGNADAAYRAVELKARMAGII